MAKTFAKRSPHQTANRKNEKKKNPLKRKQNWPESQKGKYIRNFGQTRLDRIKDTHIHAMDSVGQCLWALKKLYLDMESEVRLDGSTSCGKSIFKFLEN